MPCGFATVAFCPQRKTTLLEPIIEHGNVVFLVTKGGSDWSADGHVAGAYAGIFTAPAFEQPFWGWGGVANPLILYAYGIAHAIEVHSAYSNEPDPHITVIAPSASVIDFLKDNVSGWIANGGKNKNGGVPDAYPEWKRCYGLFLLGKLEVTETGKMTGHKVSMRAVGSAVSKRLAEAEANDANKYHEMVRRG
jgi:hypothetical protein